MTVKKWYLIRHGETDFNKKRFSMEKRMSFNQQRRERTESCPPSSIVRKEEAFLEFIQPSSKRTQETAAIIFPVKVTAYKALNEEVSAYGGGRTANEIQAAFPLVWEEWLENPFEGDAL